jgi:hypothetical protein
MSYADRQSVQGFFQKNSDVLMKFGPGVSVILLGASGFGSEWTCVVPVATCGLNQETCDLNQATWGG